MPNGRIDVDGASYPTPSTAAAAIANRSTNGWTFFLLDPVSRRSRRDVWREYVDSLTEDVEDDEADDNEGEDEA